MPSFPPKSTSARAPTSPETRQVQRYLDAIHGREPRPALIEIRWRHRDGMRQSFIRHDRTLAAARTIVRLTDSTDVYVGVTPRHRRGGGKDAIDRVWALWADLDQPHARDALDRLPVPPAIVIASGTAGHLHAYWLLAAAVSVATAESANRRLAAQLAADTGAVTNAATILRPPATFSHKATPPTRVVLEHLEPTTTTLQAATDGIAADPVSLERSRSGTEDAGLSSRRPAGDRGDPLRALDPAVYFGVLTGETVGRSRKVSCPWHEDRTPSMHVYENPADGWHCFGCQRHGHSAYDLAGQLWGLQTRGRDFIELRARLHELFLPAAQGARPQDRDAARDVDRGPRRPGARHEHARDKPARDDDTIPGL